MRLFEHRRRILLGGAFVVVVCATFYFFRPSMTPSAMLACLPPGDGPVLYVDVGLLRQTGLLEQLAGKPGGEEADYRKFVDASGFDYRRDLDAALVQWRKGTALFVLKGRFDGERLAAYAGANGGLCAKDFCSLPGSVPQRRISFQPLSQPLGHPLGRRVMALATGTDAMGAAAIREHASQPAFAPPSAPLWVCLPASSFHAEPDLPPGLSAFLESLDGSQRALLTVETHTNGFALQLNAPCKSSEQAKTVADRLTRATATLRDLIARSGKAPEPSSPAAILSAGKFSVERAAVHGNWPLSRAFFEGLGK